MVRLTIDAAPRIKAPFAAAHWLREALSRRSRPDLLGTLHREPGYLSWRGITPNVADFDG